VGLIGRPQFRLRSLFILTAIVAVGCLVGPPIVREVQIRLRARQIRRQMRQDLAADTVGMLPPLSLEQDKGIAYFNRDRAAIQAPPPKE